METVNKRAEFEAYEEYNPKGFKVFVIIFIIYSLCCMGAVAGFAYLLVWLLKHGM